MSTPWQRKGENRSKHPGRSSSAWRIEEVWSPSRTPVFPQGPSLPKVPIRRRVEGHSRILGPQTALGPGQQHAEPPLKVGRIAEAPAREGRPLVSGSSPIILGEAGTCRHFRHQPGCLPWKGRAIPKAQLLNRFPRRQERHGVEGPGALHRPERPRTPQCAGGFEPAISPWQPWRPPLAS